MRAAAVCVGDNCIDYYLPPVERRFIGGNALNAAVHMQDSGISAAYAGVVGDDDDGRAILAALRGKGLDISHVRTLPGQTAQTHILLTPQGDRQFVYEYLGPEENLVLDDETIAFLLEHRLIHTTQNGGMQHYLPRFRQHPRRALVSFDFGERSTPDFIQRNVGYADIAFFSLPEAQAAEGEDLARRLAARGPGLVVVTLGAQGSLAFDGTLHFQPAEPVQVLDTLGAGDCFIGAFLAHWLQGRPIPACMQAATHAAALTCTHYGAWPQTGALPQTGVLPQDGA